MTCPSCGTDAPATARFCPSCGFALAEAGAPLGTGDDVAPTELVEPVPPTEPVAPTEPVRTTEPVTSAEQPAGAVGHAEQDPLRRAVDGERREAASFVDAIVPVLRTPIVLRTLLATVLALAISLIVSTLVRMLIDLAAGRDLPGEGDEWWDFAWLAHFDSHQVPFDGDDAFLAVSGVILAVIALASCVAGYFLARRLLDESTTTDTPAVEPRPLISILAFALTYAIANLILGAFGPEDTGIAGLHAFLFTGAIAALAAWLVHRRTDRQPALEQPHTAPDHTGSPHTEPHGWAARTARLVSIPLRVFVGMLLVTSLLTLVANLIDLADDDDDRRERATQHVVHVVDDGWATLGHGFLASSRATGEAERGDDDDDDEETTALRIWDLRQDDFAEDGSLLGGAGRVGGFGVVSFIIVLVAGLGTVILGGLYAGFRMARAAARNLTVRDAALTGALLGPVWALVTIPMSLFVTDRWDISSSLFSTRYTTLSGIEVFFYTLLIGAALGALGGLLAARSTTAAHTPHDEA